MFWLGKRKLGHFELSPLEYMICLILFKHEKEEIGRSDGSPKMSGIDIIVELNKIFEGIWEAASGTLYPLLHKMAESRHAGDRRILHDEKKPSPLGPAKTVYELTEGARGELKTLLANNFENDIEFIERYLRLVSQVTDIQPRTATLEKLHEFLQKIQQDLVELEKLPTPPAPSVEGKKEEIKVCGTCKQETLSPETTPAQFCSHCGTKL